MILNYTYWYNGHGFEINGTYTIRNREKAEDIFKLFSEIDIEIITQINYTYSKSNTVNLILKSFFNSLIINRNIIINAIDSLILLSLQYKYCAYIVDNRINLMRDGKESLGNAITSLYKIDGNRKYEQSIREEKLYLLSDRWKDAI